QLESSVDPLSGRFQRIGHECCPVALIMSMLVFPVFGLVIKHHHKLVLEERVLPIRKKLVLPSCADFKTSLPQHTQDSSQSFGVPHSQVVAENKMPSRHEQGKTVSYDRPQRVKGYFLQNRHRKNQVIIIRS